MIRVILFFLAMTTAATSSAQNNSIDVKVNAALEADIRTSADKTRDANRKPLETLNFFSNER